MYRRKRGGKLRRKVRIPEKSGTFESSDVGCYRERSVLKQTLNRPSGKPALAATASPEPQGVGTELRSDDNNPNRYSWSSFGRGDTLGPQTCACCGLDDHAGILPGSGSICTDEIGQQSVEDAGYASSEAILEADFKPVVYWFVYTNTQVLRTTYHRVAMM